MLLGIEFVHRDGLLLDRLTTGKVREPQAIVFGVNSHVILPPGIDPSTSVFVPLTSEQSAFNTENVLDSVFPQMQIDEQVHAELQIQLEEWWQELLDVYADMGISHHRYEFDSIASNALLLRWMVSQTLSAFPQLPVVLPRDCEFSLVQENQRPDIHTDLMHAVLREECSTRQISYYEIGSSVGAIKGKQSKAHLREALPLALGRLWNASRRARVGIRMMTDWGMRFAYRQNPPSVIVIAQRPKVEELLRKPFVKRRVQFYSYQEFHRLLGLESYNLKSQYPSFTVRDIVQIHLMDNVSAADGARDAIDQFVKGTWVRLLTDAKHDALVRITVEKALAVGKHVATIPEGALGYWGPLERYGVPGTELASPGVTHFVVSNQARDYWLKHGSSPETVHVTGYLATLRKAPNVSERILKCLLEHGRCLPVGQTRVLVSIDTVLESWDLARLGTASNTEKMKCLTDLIGVIVSSGHAVVASSRRAEVARFFSRRFPAATVLSTSQIPWRVLADSCDVVCTRDSSIAWESLARGVPVLLWNFMDYPSLAEPLLEDISDSWIRIARRLDEVDAQLVALTLERRRRKLKQLSSVPTAPVTPDYELVTNWIRGA